MKVIRIPRRDVVEKVVGKAWTFYMRQTDAERELFARPTKLIADQLKEEV